MLTLEDFYTPTWSRMKALLQDRLKNLREINDGVQTEIKTAAIRGQIAEVKQMLALGPQPTASDEASTD